MSGARHWEQDKEATVYIGNLDERATDSLVWELMLQAGRIVNVHLPKDRVTQTHQGYGFVEYISEEDAEYASRIMNGIRLFGKPIRVNKASADKQKSVEIGAELFIGNLDPMVSEQILYDTFSQFGTLTNLPKVARDDNNLSKGYGFVSFADFESSDAAINNMNGQYLMNKQVSVQYAYKKDGKGERHGDEAERTLAAQARKHNVRPPTQQVAPPQFPGAAAAPPPGAGATTPAALPNGEASRPVSTAPQTPDVGMGRGMPMPMNYQSVPPPPPQQGRPSGPPPASLMTPPPGLPARPPPSQAGYGGPQTYHPPGFNGAGPQAPFQPPPAGAPAPPPGFAPPGFAPPQAGAMAPGAPPTLPPGFQPPGYGAGR
ncbi:Spliceosome-associated protein [Penicillium ucsense]|uniref:Spliceosome-associated protein n=1 Tax=Penicillium ucsense TaxID=2839758 RepID=A0A8J8W0B2_9EURO|nr:Spliceosome-associated protein [Penicillium ucsense]KAF7733662.1 Spliceosome-associated protein [Penicillium ucsense]